MQNNNQEKVESRVKKSVERRLYGEIRKCQRRYEINRNVDINITLNPCDANK